MKKIKFLTFTAILMILLSACGTSETVPITGRKHKIGVSDQQVLALSNQEYSKYMATAVKSTNATNTAMVNRVGRRLADAVDSYLNTHGYQSEVKNFQWEFNLVQNKEANAFCMPGGKIVVYEGLLPYTQDETSLAIVLGHEIAHAVAKHSAEQMTKQQNQQLGTNIGANIIGAVTGSSDLGNIASQVAGQYFSFANLKYSRDDELEADHMGLIFAAMAGYNPQEAITFWKRMSASTGSANVSDFMSDHPSDAKRIAALQAEMPEALKYYQPSQTTTLKSYSSPSSTKKVTKKKTTRRR
ncbi:MAG: M48 family metallopeptidase [Prevotella sp.]|jgi:predicted Zn-dependent protease|nr:M48 family metallopeptidase [Prevotella sp.]MCH3995762.1 M48 family metallopeptidase [Prevotella sp.]MCI1247016.1 M48 family metallopeptidase [Prevotella sp.]